MFLLFLNELELYKPAGYLQSIQWWCSVCHGMIFSLNDSRVRALFIFVGISGHILFVRKENDSVWYRTVWILANSRLRFVLCKTHTLTLIICYISSCPTKPSKYCWGQQSVPPSWLVNYIVYCLLFLFWFPFFSRNLILRICSRRCRRQLNLNLRYI